MKDQKTMGRQPTTAERVVAEQRRRQSLIGAVAGVAVIAVLVGTFVWVQNSDDEGAAAPAPATASAAPQPVESQPQPDEATPQEPAQPEVPAALSRKPVVKPGTGTLKKLTVTPLIAGKGPVVAKGQTITVNYVGTFYANGKEFDASWGRGAPASFPIGVGQVIKGWDQGLVGARVGSRVQLDIPGALAYGETPQGGRPGGPLRFVVDILAAQ